MISFDLETRGVVDLRKCGSYRYAIDSLTDVWCLCYHDSATDEYHTWLPNDDVPSCFLESDNTYCAWNAQFERNIHQHILQPRYGFPYIDIEQWHDTAAFARQLGLPGALGKAGVALGLPLDQQKDKEGSKVMMRMARPRKWSDRGVPIWWDEQEKLDVLIDYCLQDVKTEKSIRNLLIEIAKYSDITLLT